jgi:hypothetical protein
MSTATTNPKGDRPSLKGFQPSIRLAVGRLFRPHRQYRYYCTHPLSFSFFISSSSYPIHPPSFGYVSHRHRNPFPFAFSPSSRLVDSSGPDSSNRDGCLYGVLGVSGLHLHSTTAWGAFGLVFGSGIPCWMSVLSQVPSFRSLDSIVRFDHSRSPSDFAQEGRIA